MQPPVNYKLYIDENGTPNFSHNSQNYTLSGIIVNSAQADELKIRADQVKFKYWNRTNIVFHSREIAKKINDFAILQDPAVESAFLDDLGRYLLSAEFNCIVVSINKATALQNGWSETDVMNKAYDKLIETYLTFLDATVSKGQIILESSGGKDIIFYRRYAAYLSKGFPALPLTHHGVKRILTSLSFVSKENYDIETQVADLFAYPATRYCLSNEGIITLQTGTHEHSLCGILHTKLLSVGGQTIGYTRLP